MSLQSTSSKALLLTAKTQANAQPLCVICAYASAPLLWCIQCEQTVVQQPKISSFTTFGCNEMLVHIRIFAVCHEQVQ